MRIVVSDTSPVRALHHVRRLQLLPDMFGRVIVPPAVGQELLHPAGRGLPLDIQGQPGFDVMAVKSQANVGALLNELDRGEAEAIVLAEELAVPLLLIDERAGIRAAQSRNIPTIGVLGILARARNEGRLHSIRPILDELQASLDFWISPALRSRVLKSVHEEP